MEVAKGVADTQQIRFRGDGTLTLDVAEACHGTVVGLGTGDMIDLANFAFAGKPEVVSATNTTVDGVAMVAVTITDRNLTTTIDLNNMAGIYSADIGAYSLTSDNNSAGGHHPGTLFQLSASPAHSAAMARSCLDGPPS